MNPKNLSILMVMEADGGVLTHVEGIVYFLSDTGCLIHLAYSDVRMSDRLKDLLAFIQDRGGKTLNLSVGNKPQPRDLPAFIALRKMIKRVNPDIIHAHSSKAGGLARALAIIGERRPIFYTPNAYYGMTYERNRTPYHYIERFLGKFSVTVNVSNDEKRFAQDILNILPLHQELIFNSVNPSIFYPPSLSDRANARKALGLPLDSIVLGTIARLTWQKDPETLYQAFAKISYEHPSVVLLHVGYGDKSAEIEKLIAHLGISEKVYRINYLRDALPIYHAIDAFILGSRFEGMSFAILEAMSCERPIIISDALGNRDFARLGLSHFWNARKEDAEDFSRAISEFLESEKLGKPNNHRDIVKTWFDSKTQHLTLLNAYHRKLKMARNPLVIL